MIVAMLTALPVWKSHMFNHGRISSLQRVFIVGCLTGLLVACDGTTLGHFDVDEALPETRIEGNAVAAVLPEFFPAIALDVTASEAFQSEEYDFLTSVQLDALTLNITESSNNSSIDTLEDGEPDDFNFLISMDIYIQAEIDGDIQRELIGQITENDPQLSATVQSISFQMTGVNILQFIESDNGYEVQIQASGEAPDDAVIFDGDVRYRVGIGFR